MGGATKQVEQKEEKKTLEGIVPKKKSIADTVPRKTVQVLTPERKKQLEEFQKDLKKIESWNVAGYLVTACHMAQAGFNEEARSAFSTALKMAENYSSESKHESSYWRADCTALVASRMSEAGIFKEDDIRSVFNKALKLAGKIEGSNPLGDYRYWRWEALMRIAGSMMREPYFKLHSDFMPIFREALKWAKKAERTNDAFTVSESYDSTAYRMGAAGAEPKLIISVLKDGLRMAKKWRYIPEWVADDVKDAWRDGDNAKERIRSMFASIPAGVKNAVEIRKLEIEAFELSIKNLEKTQNSDPSTWHVQIWFEKGAHLKGPGVKE